MYCKGFLQFVDNIVLFFCWCKQETTHTKIFYLNQDRLIHQGRGTVLLSKWSMTFSLEIFYKKVEVFDKKCGIINIDK